MSIDWKGKLCSRKLWAALLAAGLAASAAIFGDNMATETVEMLKTGIYGLIAYIFGEGVVDAARLLGQDKSE